MKNQELAYNIRNILKTYVNEPESTWDIVINDIMELVNEEIFQAICDARGD